MGLDPQEVLEALDIPHRDVNSRGEIPFCCSEHHDRHPSASMNATTGQWICFGCGAHGNVTTLLRLLDREDLLGSAKRSRPYERTTTRTPGDIAALLEQMRLAQFMLDEGYRREDVLRGLQDACEISRSTAYEIVGWLTGKRRLQRDERGRLRGRRYAYCVKHLREHSKEHRLAVKAEKGYWSERTRILRSYLWARVDLQEVKYGRDRLDVGTHDGLEEAMAARLIPRPPPEIARWSRLEIAYLTAEVVERQLRGVSLRAPWEIEPVTVTGLALAA